MLAVLSPPYLRNSIICGPFRRLFISTMATAATAAASPGQQDNFVVDQRNLAWKADNVGSKLLAKMGWREGQAVGKRQREQGVTNVSGQGLRAVKRREKLGLGASSSALKNADPQHVGDFGQVLAALREEHGGGGGGGSVGKQQQKAAKKKSKRRSSSSTTAVLPTNKATHAAVRHAKFQEKSADDLKCIFAGAPALEFPKILAGDQEEKTSSSSSNKKRKSSSSSDKDKRKKKKKSKKQRKET